MLINFKNVRTKELLFSKESEQMPLLPRVDQALRLDDGKIGRVVDIEYFLNKKPQLSYEKIEVFLEVYALEKVSSN